MCQCYRRLTLTNVTAIMAYACQFLCSVNIDIRGVLIVDNLHTRLLRPHMVSARRLVNSVRPCRSRGRGAPAPAPRGRRRVWLWGRVGPDPGPGLALAGRARELSGAAGPGAHPVSVFMMNLLPPAGVHKYALGSPLSAPRPRGLGGHGGPRGSRGPKGRREAQNQRLGGLNDR